MNLKFIYFTFSLLLFALIWSSSSGGRATAANQGNTGAPCDDSRVCGSCHSSGNYGTVTMDFQVTDPASGAPISTYLPGMTYTVSLTVIPEQGTPAGYGCQFTAVLPDNSQAGTFQNPASNTQIGNANTTCGTRDYVEHNDTSPSPTFTAEWVAPPSGLGDVTFYYVGNCVNGFQGTSGDNGTVSFNAVFPEAPPCPSDLPLTGIIDGTYQAGINITATDATVVSGTDVVLDAGESIDIHPESTIELGATFEAKIGGCLTAPAVENSENEK